MASRPRPKVGKLSLKRVTPKTHFHIDFDWWDQSDLDLKTYLSTRVSSTDEAFSAELDSEKVDLVDSKTGEVRRVDGFQYLVQAYFNQLPAGFVMQASLVDAVFSVLLANANKPMTASEIADQIGRPVLSVVRTLGGPKIYQGIRPIFD